MKVRTVSCFVSLAPLAAVDGAAPRATLVEAQEFLAAARV